VQMRGNIGTIGKVVII